MQSTLICLSHGGTGFSSSARVSKAKEKKKKKSGNYMVFGSLKYIEREKKLQKTEAGIFNCKEKKSLMLETTGEA